MNFLLGPVAARRPAVCDRVRLHEFQAQYTASAPKTVSRPSIVARSPGRPRTMIGLRAVPVSVLVKSPL